MSSVIFSQSSQYSAHENETKESRGRLLLIIVKGEKIDDPNGRKQALTLSYACFVQCLFFSFFLLYILLFRPTFVNSSLIPFNQISVSFNFFCIIYSCMILSQVPTTWSLKGHLDLYCYPLLTLHLTRTKVLFLSLSLKHISSVRLQWPRSL